MQRWSKPRRHRKVPLTPLIDVVFLLLIFFVMAGRFADEARLVIKAPQPAQVMTSDDPPPMMLVQVDRAGALSLLGSPIDAAALAARRPEDAAIVLRLAPEMPLEVMIGVIDGLHALGIEDLSYWPEDGT